MRAKELLLVNTKRFHVLKILRIRQKGFIKEKIRKIKINPGIN